MHYALSGLVTALLLAGCDTKETPVLPPLEPGVYVGESAKSLSAMAQGDVVVRVNRAEFTRRDFDRLMNMHEAVYKLNKPGAQAAEVDYVMRNRSQGAVDEFISRELLLQEAARRNLTPSDEGRAVNANSLRALETRHKKTMDEIFHSLGDSGVLLKQRLEEDALIQTLRLEEHGDRMRVGDADIEAYYVRHIARNERLAATNALIMARGKTLVGWLVDEDFMEIREKFSEFIDDDEPGGEWGEFLLSEIDDPEIRKAAAELPVGGIGGPFDAEEGMVIIKVLAREGAGEESVLNPNPMMVKLARIGLRMYESVSVDDPLPERADVRRELERQRMMEVQREWFPKLHEAARIEYPNGTNFWERARGGRR